MAYSDYRIGLVFVPVLSKLATVMLLATGACSNRSDTPGEFFEVREGWTRCQVVELLGEPSQVLIPPFNDEVQKECRSSAETKLVFSHGETGGLFVFLDKEDVVLCTSNYFRFMSH